MNEDESSTVKKMRKKLSREYDCEVYEEDFNLAVRIPIESIEMFDQDDLPLIRESVDKLDKRTVEEKTVSAFLIADEDHLEMGIDLFLEALEEEDVGAILGQLARGEAEKRSTINQRVRKMIEELSREQQSRAIESFSGGGSTEAGATRSVGGRGKVVGSKKAREDTSFGDIALVPSVRKAVREGSFDRLRGLNIKKDHLQENIYRTKMRTNVCILVDTSLYPDMREEINTMLWIIRIILTMAYENRYHVGMVSFSGNSAEVKLPFTTDVDKGYEVVESFDYGGLSPLNSALKTGITMLERQRGDRAKTVSLMVVLTRGKANVPLYTGGFVRRELNYLTELLGERPIQAIMVHIGDENEELMKEISFKSRSRYYNPPLLSETSLDV